MPELRKRKRFWNKGERMHKVRLASDASAIHAFARSGLQRTRKQIEKAN